MSIKGYNLRNIQDHVNRLLNREGLALTMHRHASTDNVTITVSRFIKDEYGYADCLHTELVCTEADLRYGRDQT